MNSGSRGREDGGGGGPRRRHVRRSGLHHPPDPVLLGPRQATGPGPVPVPPPGHQVRVRVELADLLRAVPELQDPVGALAALGQHCGTRGAGVGGGAADLVVIDVPAHLDLLVSAPPPLP